MQDLSGVSATLLLPLVARHRETQRPGGILRDPKSTEVLERLRPDYTPPRGFGVIQLEVALRTEVLDQCVAAFLAEQSDGVVINLGAGLCTRFCRLDNGLVRWFEVDLPAVRNVWGRVFDETDRRRFLIGSALDEGWRAEVAALPGKKLFIAEGLLMYFREEDVRRLLAGLHERFPGAEMVLEAWSPWVARRLNRHPAIEQLGVRFEWGVERGKELEQWGTVRVVREHHPLTRHPQRLKWRRIWLMCPWFRRLVKILHVQFREAAAPRRTGAREE